MDTKEKEKRATVAMFLSYCRKAIVNARTDVLRECSRRRKREVLFCDMRTHDLERLSGWQDIPDSETVFDVAGKRIGVSDEDLADALNALPETEQAIVLLSYFAGWSDNRIGNDIGCPRSTVQSRRIRALNVLQKALERGGCSHGKNSD